MSKTLLFLLILLSPGHPRDPHVIQLSDHNFPKLLVRNDNFLVMFFIPWSGLCQKLRTQFARAAKFVYDNRLPVAVGKMDCSGLGRKTCEHKQLGLDLPAIHYYQKGLMIKEYKGAKDSLSLIKFVRAQVVPAAIELKTMNDFKDFLKEQQDVVVVGLFEEESRLKKMFFKVAEEWKESIIFAYTMCEKILKREGVLNGIVLYRPNSFFSIYEEERVLFNGRVVIGEIKNFINTHYYGLVGHRTSLNKLNFPNPVIVLYYNADYHGDDLELTYWKSRMIKVAKKYQDHVKFAISASDEFEDELADYTVDYTNLMRPFVLARDLENKKYVMSDNFSTLAFDKFVDNFINGQLTPFLKSEPIPYENDGAVIIAVASNFDAVAINNGKDTFIDLYTPWSAKAKKFAPVMRQVADLLQEENIVVVKMDTTENEVPELFAGRVIPGAYFLRKDRKVEPVWYQGGISLDDTIKFIAKMATTELHHFDRNGIFKQEREEL